MISRTRIWVSRWWSRLRLRERCLSTIVWWLISLFLCFLLHHIIAFKLFLVWWSSEQDVIAIIVHEKNSSVSSSLFHLVGSGKWGFFYSVEFIFPSALYKGNGQ